jgi:hypothetical protein
MGFRLDAAEGRSIAIKPKKSHGAPAIINLYDLLAVKYVGRVKWLCNTIDQNFTGQAADGVKS